MKDFPQSRKEIDIMETLLEADLRCGNYSKSDLNELLSYHESIENFEACEAIKRVLKSTPKQVRDNE